MSFTTNVKNEISQEISNQTANQAELSAILRNSYNRNNNTLDLVTENSTVCKHIYTLFKELYNILNPLLCSSFVFGSYLP